MTTVPTSAVLNAAVAASTDLVSLHAKLETIDPTLAASLESKPLAASKTPWGVLGAAAVAYASSRYGLGLDQSMDALIAGAAVLAASYLMRWLSPTTIRGLFKTPVASTAK